MDAKTPGHSIVLKGQLTASEDLTIRGRVEGTIELREHVLTVGDGATVSAQIAAKGVVVAGAIVGNVTATDRIEIRENGSVEGDLKAPRIAMQDGASFRGRVDMQQSNALPKTEGDGPKMRLAIAV
jgi:cytoskeletal protein CcmA (bactofilin family)